jgi:CheY-like chemotaxis protein
MSKSLSACLAFDGSEKSSNSLAQVMPAYAISRQASDREAKSHRRVEVVETAASEQPKSSSQALLSVKRVAIAGDNRDVAMLYEHVIRGLQLSMEFVGYDGSEIVEAVVSGRAHPDIILMDYRMPVMNGLDAAAKVHQANPSIRIIIATADDSIIQRAKEMGFEAIQKPFSIKQLRRVLLAQD